MKATSRSAINRDQSDLKTIEVPESVFHRWPPLHRDTARAPLWRRVSPVVTAAAEKLNTGGTIGEKYASGAEARVDFAVFAARLKSRPDTKPSTPGVFPQPVKPSSAMDETRSRASLPGSSSASTPYLPATRPVRSTIAPPNQDDRNRAGRSRRLAGGNRHAIRSSIWFER